MNMYSMHGGGRGGERRRRVTVIAEREEMGVEAAATKLDRIGKTVGMEKGTGNKARVPKAVGDRGRVT